MKTFLFAMTVLLSMSAVAQPSEQRSTTFEPCANWWYDFDSNSYTCRWKDPRVTVYSASEVDALVGKLNQKIADLENRVKALEAKP